MHRFWTSVMGTGYSPFAPGTCGSAVVAVVFLLTAVLSGSSVVSGSPVVVATAMLIVATIGFVVTVLFGDRVISRHGADPGVIVSDEQCGQALSYLWLWRADNFGQWLALAVAGFLLFRFFDIVKVPPARQLEHVKGAWGVLLDDVMAGVYANIVLQIVWRLRWLDALVS